MPPYDIASIKAYLSENGVNVMTHMLHIKYASYIGGEMYKKLHTTLGGEMIFSALLFPDNASRLKRRWTELTDMNESEFDELIVKTDTFCTNYIAEQKEKLATADVIHFHLYTKSLFASLYLSKCLNKQFDCEIWFSGYHCQGDCGESLQKMFPYIDRIIDRDVERSILKELCGKDFESDVNGIDYLPTPDYSDFINSISLLTESFRNKYVSRYWLQVEFNRGCWWNKCTFCTLNCQYSNFDEKSLSNIIRDYSAFINKYKTLQIIVYERNSGSNWKEIITELDNRFPGMRGTYSLSFKVSNLLDPKDILFLKEHKVTFLVGVESLSPKCLKKIDKGQTVLENILMLKYSERFDAKCYHNLMYAFPFETEDDLVITRETIHKIYHLTPPFDAEEFRLTQGSEIQKYPERYGVKSMRIRQDIEGLLFPEEYHRSYSPFFYDFVSINDSLEERKSKWRDLIEEWRKTYYRNAYAGIPKKYSLLYMRSHDELLEIYDARYSELSQVYVYDQLSKAIYEYCDLIREESEILHKFSNESERDISMCLNMFIEQKTMIKEGTKYLSLAI